MFETDASLALTEACLKETDASLALTDACLKETDALLALTDARAAKVGRKEAVERSQRRSETQLSVTFRDGVLEGSSTPLDVSC